MDHLVGWLFDSLAQSRKLETRPKESEATSRTKDEELHAEIECREKAHQQAIIELTAERDHARELLRQREGEAVAAENKAAQLSQKMKRLEETLEEARKAMTMKDMENSAF